MKQGSIPRLMLGLMAAVTALALGRSAVLHRPVTAGLAYALQLASAHPAGSFSPSHPDAPNLAKITVDYPQEGSIFPPDITPPTFLWRDASNRAAVWTIDVAFSDGTPGIRTKSEGAGLRIGEIDPRCVSATNELPKLTPQQAAAHTWIPDEATWEAIKEHSREHDAAITITTPWNPYIYYDLARTQALNQQKKRALKTLQVALEKGFDDAHQLEADRAFAGLHTEAAYQSVLDRMRRSRP